MLSLQRKNLLVGVNVARDPDNLSVLEQLHLPEINCPPTVQAGRPFPISVTVGTSRPHPNDQRHFVERVSIFADDTLLASLLPHADSSPPGVSVRVTLNRDVQSIRAEVHCNLHGTWEARRPISVESAR